MLGFREYKKQCESIPILTGNIKGEYEAVRLAQWFMRYVKRASTRRTAPMASLHGTEWCFDLACAPQMLLSLGELVPCPGERELMRYMTKVLR